MPIRRKAASTTMRVAASALSNMALDRADATVRKMQISPVIVNGFENGFHRWIQRIFLVIVKAKKIGFRNFFLKVGSTLRPCSG